MTDITSMKHKYGTKKTLNAHHGSSKAFLLFRKILLQILAARFTREKEQNEREEWERFGQHKLALRIDVK
jgi:hypothetical protein